MEKIETLEGSLVIPTELVIETSTDSLDEIDVKEYDQHELSDVENSFEGTTDFQDSHERYMNSLENEEHIECLTDLETTENIADYLLTVEGLQYENWCNLTPEERVSVLNEVEENIAKIEHRPSMRVNSEQMAPTTLGFKCSDEDRIAINSQYLESNDRASYTRIVETIIHEGRHAYQMYNVDVKCIHESESEVNTWRENFYDPMFGYYNCKGDPIIISTSTGFSDLDTRTYYYQPVEIDARNFTSDVMDKLENAGMLHKSDAKLTLD